MKVIGLLWPPRDRPGHEACRLLAEPGGWSPRALPSLTTAASRAAPTRTSAPTPPGTRRSLSRRRIGARNGGARSPSPRRAAGRWTGRPNRASPAAATSTSTSARHERPPDPPPRARGREGGRSPRRVAAFPELPARAARSALPEDRPAARTARRAPEEASRATVRRRALRTRDPRNPGSRPRRRVRSAPWRPPREASGLSGPRGRWVEPDPDLVLHLHGPACDADRLDSERLLADPRGPFHPVAFGRHVERRRDPSGRAARVRPRRASARSPPPSRRSSGTGSRRAVSTSSTSGPSILFWTSARFAGARSGSRTVIPFASIVSSTDGCGPSSTFPDRIGARTSWLSPNAENTPDFPTCTVTVERFTSTARLAPKAGPEARAAPRRKAGRRGPSRRHGNAHRSIPRTLKRPSFSDSVAGGRLTRSGL